jgi:hypothetical protein
MATLPQTPLTRRRYEEEINALTDALFELTAQQLAMMTPEKRAAVIANIHATADEIAQRQ